MTNGLFSFSIPALFIFFLFLPQPLMAAIDPREILAVSDAARGNVEGVEWVVTTESGENDNVQKQQLLVRVRGFNCLAEYLSPAKVKGRKILMLDRNMWFIKPGLRKPVPISPRQKLVGGASNGDIASTNYAGDYETLSLVEDTVKGEPCYLLELQATNKKTTYDRIKYWISKERLVGVKSEFYTVSGMIIKTAEFEYKNRVIVEGKSQPFISRMIITDAVQKDQKTIMTYGDIILKAIPDSVFNLNLLVR